MKKTKGRFPIRKRSYLLFELLLALGLLTLVLLPIVRSHTAMRKAEYQHLQTLEQERLSQQIFCAVKSQLYMWKHSWEELKGKKIEETVDVDRVAYTYELEYSKKHHKKNGMVLEVTIILPQYSVKRTLYVSR